ncbi:MAG: hydrogenase maturation nickel metallochaperone HypA [Acidobacteriaceae bacterium]
MHELSIAYSIVEIATESAREAGATRVREVHVRLGALSGVVRGALEFSYEVACADTPLEGSTLVVRELPAKVYCKVCEMEVELRSVQYFCCPRCDTPSGDLRQGREMDVEAIEVDLPGEGLSGEEDGNAGAGDSQRDSE